MFIENKTPVYVTKTYLPDRDKFDAYIDKIWDSATLTNNGPLSTELTKRMSEYLNVNNMFYVSNGTIALQLALQAYDLHDCEVITTPFSYVATTSSILWQGCTPVFADIDPKTLCINPACIEKLITPKTRAIMAVHVFGFPCDIDAIERIAKKHNLIVIYDGAHAFGAKFRGKSLLDYGDISTCSFHATKLFHTVEGGAVIVRDPLKVENVGLSMRFGHNVDEHIQLGINAKNSEIHAAMGLCNLDEIDAIINRRGEIVRCYSENLGDIIFKPNIILGDEYIANNAYCPAIFNSFEQMQAVLMTLNENNVFPRRYFYPSLNKLPYVNGEECPVSEDISQRILCLPLYPTLTYEEQSYIIRIIQSIL